MTKDSLLEQSENAERQTRHQRYRPYPPERIHELEELCRERARKGALTTQSVSKRISTLVQGLDDFGKAGVGDQVAGARLLELIDQGEFGSVWKAIEPGGGDCAVKIFHPYRLGDGQMVRRFRRGVAAMRLLQKHGPPPGIIEWRDSEDTDLAFTMNFVDGGDLREVSARRWSLFERLDVFEQLCEAISFAHRNMVVHRDIKPANVLVTKNRQVVLTDFDLADLVQLGQMTQDSRGTPRYAAPEQIDPKERSDDPPRLKESDIYSLGRMLQYLITEREPSLHFAEDDLAQGLRDHSGMRELVEKCTQRDPGRRYDDVDILLRDFRALRDRPGELLAVRNSTHTPVPLPSPSDDAVRKRIGQKWSIIATVGVGLLTAGATIWGSVIEGSATKEAAAIGASEVERAATSLPNLPSIARSNREEPISPQPLEPTPDKPERNPEDERKTLWLLKGFGRRENQKSALPLRDDMIPMAQGKVLIGQFECAVRWGENGDPTELSDCRGRGNVRTQSQLSVPLHCSLHESRKWTGCTSDPFTYGTSGVTRKTYFILSLVHD